MVCSLSWPDGVIGDCGICCIDVACLGVEVDVLDTVEASDVVRINGGGAGAGGGCGGGGGEGGLTGAACCSCIMLQLLLLNKAEVFSVSFTRGMLLLPRCWLIPY